MPNIGFDAGVVLLLLLPGFISARIVQLFCAQSKHSQFERVIDALIHTFVVIVLYAVCVRQLPLRVTSWVQDKTSYYDVFVFRWKLLLLLGISIAWGFLATACKNKDWPWKWLRRWGLTQQSARGSVWHDALYEYGDKGYVQVELSDGRFVLGYLRNYSHSSKDPGLFVSEASWVAVEESGETAVTPISGAGILLTKASGIVNVMFLHPVINESQTVQRDLEQQSSLESVGVR